MQIQLNFGNLADLFLVVIQIEQVGFVVEVLLHRVMRELLTFLHWNFLWVEVEQLQYLLLVVSEYPLVVVSKAVGEMAHRLRLIITDLAVRTLQHHLLVIRSFILTSSQQQAWQHLQLCELLARRLFQ